ncbi:MAG: polymer-forming cytoskeletal protein [Leptospirales bacterium]|jgi:cytoskeletal protein CcmA (bactofilin family)
MALDARQNHIGGTLHVKNNQVMSDTNLIIDGDVITDDLRAPGKTVIISKGCTVQANIECNILQVIGTLQGNVSATELIELADDCVVQGDIVAPMIEVAYRARLSGSMRYS